MWKLIFGDLSMGPLLAISMFLIGLGVVAGNVIRRKIKERELLMLSITEVTEVTEALPEVQKEEMQVVKTPRPEEPIDQDQVSKISVPATETLETPTVAVEKIKPETEQPIPEQQTTKTRTKNWQREIKPKQTMIPVPTIKPPKAAAIIKKDQHHQQPPPKMAPLKRSPVVIKPVAVPKARRTVGALRDPNENPDGQRALSPAETRKRALNAKPANWKN